MDNKIALGISSSGGGGDSALVVADGALATGIVGMPLRLAPATESASLSVGQAAVCNGANMRTAFYLAANCAGLCMVLVVALAVLVAVGMVIGINIIVTF